jgi:diaminohydroxyphosphoribosylaminopyrimidine deaminase/5-amino-6-(5-phosphoribosylamino)uracil reductase
VTEDAAWMRRALQLAERGRGAVEPNPLVGAVVVRDGQLVGEGWHRRYGGPHAEVHALDAAGPAARGATLYVTLEPCCHHGKTPPCTDAVLRAGIGRVVAALEDPFPQVAGRGASILREAGVAVEFGVGSAAALAQNAPYLCLLTHARPFVHAKWAMTLDGRIATRTGHSQWISGPESRAVVHDLRGKVDAVLVGRGTAWADDPLLTARPSGPRTATRIVLARDGRLPPSAKLLATARETPVIVAVGPSAPAEVLAELRTAGVEPLTLPADADGVSVPALLAELGRRRMTNVLVEGGSGILGSFLRHRLIDEAHVFVAPVLVGGASALGPVGGEGVGTIADGLRLTACEVRATGADVYLRGRAARQST